MRTVDQYIIDRWIAGQFLGQHRTHGRVTVEPDWRLHLEFGGGLSNIPRPSQLPYRYFQDLDNDQVEVEVPNVTKIDWERSLKSDAGSCTITIANVATSVASVQSGVAGIPGAYTWAHGQPDAAARWGQTPNSWWEVLIPNALLRTYEGYGGFEEDGTPMSIPDAVAGGYLYLTGLWLVDEVNVSSNGTLSLRCRDMAKLLIEQIVFPPFSPPAWYPIRFARYKYTEHVAKAIPVYDSTDPIESGPGAEGPKYITDIAMTADGKGYYLVGTDGGVFTFGRALFYGSRGGAGDVDPAPMISIASDPLGHGYWLTDTDGDVYTFGQVLFYGNAPGPAAGTIRTIAAHPGGRGYWLLGADGTVYEFGAADHFGDSPAFSGFVMDMGVTDTGEGYWLLDSTGAIFTFGDALYYGGANDLPAGPLSPEGVVVAGNIDLEARPIVENADGTVSTVLPFTIEEEDLHVLIPTVVDGPPRILTNDEAIDYYHFTGQHLGKFDTEAHAWIYAADLISAQNLYYTIGPGGLSTCVGMSVMPDGNGYLITDDQGNVAPFGSARLRSPNGSWKAAQDNLNDPIMAMASTPTGNGYLLVGGDGGVFSFGDAPFYGSLPGDYTYISREDGNYTDLTEVVAALLKWAGWCAVPEPEDSIYGVYGNLESTGTFLTEAIPIDTFDRKPIIDGINAMREIVNYGFWIDEEGAAHWESLNFYAFGNFMDTGQHVETLVEIDERYVLSDYAVSFADQAVKSELIVSSHDPTVGLQDVVTTRRRMGLQLLGLDLNRGMVRPYLWVNDHWSKVEDQEALIERLMDLITFSLRRGTVRCVANPRIQINDQVRIYERVTSETYVHWVEGIRSSHDLMSGEWTYDITTGWLGEDWEQGMPA